MDCATYTVLVTYDEPSEAYIARVPEVPGCISQGETRQEALQNVRHDLEACLEVMRDAGEEVPLPHRYEIDQVSLPLPVGA
jgi:antitoxin HicB